MQSISGSSEHYASAVEWLEATEEVAEDDREVIFEIRQLLSVMRRKHDAQWQNPLDVKHKAQLRFERHPSVKLESKSFSRLSSFSPIVKTTSD